MYQELHQLYQSGTLKKLVLNGFISPKILHYLEICHYVNAKIAANQSKTSAVYEAAEELKISDRTIWRVLKILDQE